MMAKDMKCRCGQTVQLVDRDGKLFKEVNCDRCSNPLVRGFKVIKDVKKEN